MEGVRGLSSHHRHRRSRRRTSTAPGSRMRLLKKSVNETTQGHATCSTRTPVGHPARDLTFFPGRSLPSSPGAQLSSEVSPAVPPGALDFWGQRLESYGDASDRTLRRARASARGHARPACGVRNESACGRSSRRHFLRPASLAHAW